MLLTVHATTPAILCGLGAVVMILAWMWNADPEPLPPVDVGGLMLPTYVSGPQSHAWWAMVVLLLVGASLYLSYVFSYLYLWTVLPETWPDERSLPDPNLALASAVLLLLGSLAVIMAGRVLHHCGWASAGFVALLLAAVLAMAGSLSLELLGHWRAGLRPDAQGYGAVVYLASFLQAQLVVAVVVTCGFVVARRLAGRLDGVRRNTFDSFALLWHYTVGQGLVGLLLVHGFPRLV
jgi:cytochrome c oxidase subunit I+III